MFNFRKLKQDFASSIVAEGKELFDKKKVVSAKILRFDNNTIRFSGKVLGNYNNTYESEIEIDRYESEMVHSNCDCAYRYDCQHLAALIYYLEEKIDALLIEYSKESNIDKDATLEETEKIEILETIKKAENKQEAKLDAQYQKQVVEEYVQAAEILSTSPFFLPPHKREITHAELALIFNTKALADEKKKYVEYQLALRLPQRSKPLQVPNISEFFDCLHHEQPLLLASKRYYFSFDSFDEYGQEILKTLTTQSYLEALAKSTQERTPRIGLIDKENFGVLLAKIFEMVTKNSQARRFSGLSEDLPALPCLFSLTLETPLHYSFSFPIFRMLLEYLPPPAAKILINPNLYVDENLITSDQASLFACSLPGMIHEGVYYRFPETIKRCHLKNIMLFRDMCICKPLFGTFVENALPELKRYAEIANEDVIEKFVTLPYVKPLTGRCVLSYLDGELEVALYFSYDGVEVSAASAQLNFEKINSFILQDGILARNLVEEQAIIDELFQDFVYLPTSGVYQTKSEKKIVEFMTEVIPKNQHRISFECPQNLLDQFVYDQTRYEIELDLDEQVGTYVTNLLVEGELRGIPLELLWECVAAKRSFLELNLQKRKRTDSLFSKILVLDLEKIGKIVQIFDEMSIEKLENQKLHSPLWTLISVHDKLFEGLPVKFTMSERLKELRAQILGEKSLTPSPVPLEIKATLRPYQLDGVFWLEKLRRMYLNGILADDMGLGKTLQSIIAITQANKDEKLSSSLVVCPTSLLYNWKEEFSKFAPHLKVQIIEGSPQVRKRYISALKDIDVVITSYTLIQKDIELYKEHIFGYVILDEAQHIKNRATRNAKSVKMIQAVHRLILTGTPIENCLADLWSLFDFLMPGLLSGYDRFSEKYVRSTGEVHYENLRYLKKKVSPFILRRMKSDVLKDLPPVSEIVYYTQLTNLQEEFYRSYAASAREELTRLVAKEGFEKVQIHVLATLTRLKQICCHPAIFAKQKAEPGDSAKYEMLLELLQTLIEGEHRVVIFSQYTQMLKIMREEFEQRGISFSYLDGDTKNRLQIVKEFNDNKKISVFLVSLKAGGTGLNITGADTVIHYDLWWNPAVENQATDRVHRIGQSKTVSSYKIITKGTIEEGIVKLQAKKKGLVKKIVSCDDEAIAKLTWEDVLELLKT